MLVVALPLLPHGLYQLRQQSKVWECQNKLQSIAVWLATLRRLGEEPAARATYFNTDGNPKKQGDRVTNPTLADTMQPLMLPTPA